MNVISKHIVFCFSVLLLLISTIPLLAQENPPIPTNVEVNPVNVMDFGSFLVDASGGTLSMDYNGFRTPGPGVILMTSGSTSAAAIFDVYANPGTILRMYHETAELTGSNGGTISLKLDSFLINDKEELDEFFITEADSDMPNTILMGGTLTIGASDLSPPGSYTGTITVTFIQE